MSATKIKVDRLALIKKLQDTDKKESTTRERKIAKYEADMEKINGKIIDALVVLLDKAKKDPSSLSIDSNYGGEVLIKLDKKIKYPQHPDNERGYRYDPDRLKKMISVLEMSNESTILVSAGDDYYHYI